IKNVVLEIRVVRLLRPQLEEQRAWLDIQFQFLPIFDDSGTAVVGPCSRPLKLHIEGTKSCDPSEQPGVSTKPVLAGARERLDGESQCRKAQNRQERLQCEPDSILSKVGIQPKAAHETL